VLFFARSWQQAVQVAVVLSRIDWVVGTEWRWITGRRDQSKAPAHANVGRDLVNKEHGLLRINVFVERIRR
jgi:hypothetical protein